MTTATTSTQLSVDRPGDGERPTVRDQVVVEGWAWAPDGPPQLTVTIGGRPAEVVPSGWRPDVTAALGIEEIRGYVAMGSTAGLPAGPAEVVVTATGSDGVTVERRRVVEVTTDPGRRQGRPRPWAGFTERLDPRVAPGSLTHVEHVARYRWTAPLAEGADVLDAACGVGYGAHLLSRAGARTVTGIDAFAGAIIEAREQAHAGLEFILGDLLDLPFADASFDLVVCFEAIEHIAEQDRLLDELKRVLRPGGVLAISTPVPGAISVHNPHHVAEIDSLQLEALLRARFAHVDLRWQHSAQASVIDLAPGDEPAVVSPPLAWTAGPTEPLYAVALAGDEPLTTLAPTGALAAGLDIGALVSQTYTTADDLAETQAMLTAERARAVRAEHAYAALEQKHAEALEAARVAAAAPAPDLSPPPPTAAPAPPPPPAPRPLRSRVRRVAKRGIKAIGRRWPE